jgi:hypothetical protein
MGSTHGVRSPQARDSEVARALAGLEPVIIAAPPARVTTNVRIARARPRASVA